MRIFALMLLILMSSGCASMFGTKDSDRVQSKSFTEVSKPLEQLTEVKVQPLPVMPTAIPATDAQGNKVVGFTKDGLDQLRQLKAAAEVNTDLANGLLSTTNSVIAERNALARLGQVEEARANYYANMADEERKRADKEHRDRVIDNWSNRILLILGAFLLK